MENQWGRDKTRNNGMELKDKTHLHIQQHSAHKYNKGRNTFPPCPISVPDLTNALVDEWTNHHSHGPKSRGKPLT